MRRTDLIRLFALGAIWGASFLLLRITVPVFGPLLTADLRMLIAGAALAAWFRAVGFDPQWRRWGRHYAAAGLITTGAPFVLFAYAALQMSAGQMAILNATSPMWGTVWSAAFLGERLRGLRVAGLVLGIAGVTLIAQPSGTSVPLAGVAACLAAAACYGFIGVYLRRCAPDAPGRGMAIGTQLTAGLIMLPLAAFWPPVATPGALAVAYILALGLVCGALAYIMYFRLITDVGATGALTVTYLVPLFAMLWGALLLGEALTLAMLAGALLVILGTVLVLRG